MVKKKTQIFSGVIEVEEYHDGRYGAPGMKRMKKKKATPEQIAKINQYNKEKKARHRLRQYFGDGDWLVTLTYKKEKRPPDMKMAKHHYRKFITKVRKEYKKRGKELYWIRNIENNSTNNWHIHLIIKDIPEIIKILNEAWPYGRVHDPKPLYKRGRFADLAKYITKDEKSTRKDIGSNLDHVVTEANYSTSRNMPIKQPEIKLLKRWQEEPKPKKGWYIDKESYYEGINPVTGYKYRHYTMFQEDEDVPLHRRS